jgi:hypothetical protein
MISSIPLSVLDEIKLSRAEHSSGSSIIFLEHSITCYPIIWIDNITKVICVHRWGAIKAKVGGNVHFNVCAFIDCNCLECCRPGGGPRDAGSDSDRWNPLIQKAFYNGWKSVHGLKHQTVDIAYGMTIDLFGPISFHHNDLHLLRQSRLNQCLREIQLGVEQQLILYGDNIYPALSHLRNSIKNLIADNEQHQN